MKTSIKKKVLFLCLCQCVLIQLCGQQKVLSGKVINRLSGEKLSAATIAVYSHKKTTGTVSNQDGFFSVVIFPETDSVKISMIGFRSVVFSRPNLDKFDSLEVRLNIEPLELSTVIVKPLSAIEIVEQAIARLPSSQPAVSYETYGFYREIIKDHENYFSVAEANFDVQFYPAQRKSALKLDRGRAKEDVSYTALFEDFHPGGGAAASDRKQFSPIYTSIFTTPPTCKI